MGRVFANPLAELAEYEEMVQCLQKGQGPLQVGGCLDSQKVHLMDALAADREWRLVVTYSDSRAREIYEDFQYFQDSVSLYPARDLLFFSADIHGNLLTKQRMEVFRRLLEDTRGTVVTTLGGLMDHLLPLSQLAGYVKCVRLGDILDMDEWKDYLTAMGYERCGQVEAQGQFCIRGGILDVFPLTEEVPVRVELWGDEVDSIRSFDLESQRSIETLQELRVYPATEMLLPSDRLEEGIQRIEEEAKKQEQKFRNAARPEEAHRIKINVQTLLEEVRQGSVSGKMESYLTYFFPETVSFFSYFADKNCVVYLDEPQRIKEQGEALEMEFRESMAQRLEKGYVLAGQTKLLYGTQEVFAKLQGSHTVYLTGLGQKLSGLAVAKTCNITVRNLNSYQNSFELLIGDLKRWKKEGSRVVLLSASATRASRLAKDLREQYDLRAYCPEDASKPVKAGEILVTYGNLHRGFEYPMLRFVVITEGDMFGTEKKKHRKKKSSYQGKRIQSFSDLAVGDYVVHEAHGLGIYRGIEKIERDKVIKDYIKIEYGDGGNLYFPAARLDVIQKYAGADAKKPKLNKLGGNDWNKTKSKVKAAVKDIAKDLVELYAERQKEAGYQYGDDTIWQKEFEELFPYDETEDQMQAIADTKADMESRKIMDRLVCGDVGYGKTEIALRAAFKAVQESKQVVYLVPTTILAQQHYNTFVQRMKDFPVRIELLCRFRTPAQIKKALEGLRKGQVDIIIGTHRVLSKDVEFKDLGLLIVDEEQRFGVTHKEKIKQLKKHVDVLTLTATPIPRTLHMSLVGIRDMSVLEEAPVDRVPIQTYVMEYNDELIREAIQRELSRNGQVYYVYNRVNNIEDVALRIAKLVPDATVVFAHGQMREHQLERIMLDFINGEIDVLISTTIIETGLDIPNANTIIIHDADQLGLAQLYQLRGRVGRSSRTSYAFLMYRRDKVLREVAEKRLQAIREFTELGSGIKIAMRDLEIRGAGNVLGEEQHGHMEAVGYDLYCKLLNEAVLALKGEDEDSFDFETTMDCDMDAYIPASYIKNEYQKLDVYKRIAAVENEEERMDMEDELIDRFGDLPKPVSNLLAIASLRAMAHRAYVTEAIIGTQEIRLHMYAKAKLCTEKIPDLLKEYRGDLRLVTSEKPCFVYVDQRKKNKSNLPLLETCREILEKLEGLRLDMQTDVQS